MAPSFGSGASLLFKKTLRLLLILALIEFLAAAFVLAPRLVTNVAGQLATKVKEQDLLLQEEKNQKDFSATSMVSASRASTTTQQETPLEHHDEFKIISPNKDGNTQPGASLALISVQQVLGNEGERTLKIAIKSQTNEAISVSDVKVQVYFYDKIDGEIVASKFPVASRWLSLPIDWKNADPQLLEVTYQPDNSNTTAHYAGYIVAVYYKGKLQGYRVDPPVLSTQFPIKVYIGDNEL